jgi:hypothetical protein
MNEPGPDPRITQDAIAIAIQQLHAQGKADDAQPLLRLDYRAQAARAPFQLDSARGKLHRTGCPAIPANSKPALYAVWDVQPEDARLACDRCKPMMKHSKPSAPPDLMDLAYGVLSVVDQFRSILFERGREYRQRLRQRNAEGPLSRALTGLGRGQGADAVVSIMDSLLEALNACNQNLNGNGNVNGAGANRTARRPEGSRRNGKGKNRTPKAEPNKKRKPSA